MSTPVIIADILGMPPLGLVTSVVVVAFFVCLVVAQIRHMVPLMRKYPWTWPQIVRDFFIGLGHRFLRTIGFLFIEAWSLFLCLGIGLLAACGLGYLKVNRYVDLGIGALIAIILWFTVHGTSGGGGPGNQHERGRRFPTRRDV